MELVRYAERPDLLDVRYERLSLATFPAFLHHNKIANRLWSRLYDEFPAFQLALVDGDALAAELHCAPLAWDGTLADLPDGWEAGIQRSFETDRPRNALHALAISVHPDRQGEGLGTRMLEEMIRLAREHELHALLACVRPTWKARYPLIPIERYVEWRRPDGAHVDPWIRLHGRAGGEILRPAPRSFTLEAPVADWEEWTGLALPEDGDYIVRAMLAPLVVRGGIGRHVEPNVWIAHTVRDAGAPA